MTRATFFRSLFLAPAAAIAAVPAAKPRPADLPLISDATDPRHDWSLNVRLDGKTLANCLRADAARGIAWCYKTGPDGQVIVDPKTRDVVLDGWRGSSARYQLQGII
jgi:hypothetical protein